jgi:hypothetical protein
LRIMFKTSPSTPERTGHGSRHDLNDYSCSFEPLTNNMRVKMIFFASELNRQFVSVQYPGEFVPTILWVSGVGAGWFAAQEARRRVAPAAQRTSPRLRRTSRPALRNLGVVGRAGVLEVRLSIDMAEVFQFFSDCANRERRSTKCGRLILS